MKPRAAFRKGGVHPPENKAQSLGTEVVRVDIPKKIRVAVTQHLGKPSRLVVERGAQVKVGDLLAEADGPISANVHSPVSGKVIKLADAPVPGAYRAPVIEIMNDGKRDGAEAWEAQPRIDWSRRDSFIDMIRDAGVVGLGGAAFPTAVKLAPPRDAVVKTLLLNGCECEPYLTADDTLMISQAPEVLAGAIVMASILGVNRVVVGVEDNKPRAIEALQASVDNGSYAASFAGEAHAPRIEIVPLRTRYPQGAEKQLIEAICGSQVAGGQLPFSVGMVVQNVGTSFAVFEAVARARPLIERIVTLSGRAIRQPGNYLVAIGTPLSDLVAAAGGTTDQLRAMIAGGPMMGKSLRSLEEPVVKGLSGVLFLDEQEVAAAREVGCIRCGRCLDVCPMGLAPCNISAQAEHQQWQQAVDLHVLDCVECGTCEYACPSNRQLVARMKLTKFYWRRMKR